MENVLKNKLLNVMKVKENLKKMVNVFLVICIKEVVWKVVDLFIENKMNKLEIVMT